MINKGSNLIISSLPLEAKKPIGISWRGCEQFKLEEKSFFKVSLPQPDKISMELLNLLEEKVNHWLWVLLRSIIAIIPAPFKSAYRLSLKSICLSLTAIRSMPGYLLLKSKVVYLSLKEAAAEIDFKSTISECEEKFKHLNHKKVTHLIYKNGAILIELGKKPFRGFSTLQTILLAAFSIASIACSLTIYEQFKQIYSTNGTQQRSPASVEVVQFERPTYYKEVFRQVKVAGIRIPVYYPQVNELQTVTIDFSATLSNRFGRVFIEHREHLVRDHLIRTLEPVLAQYSLDNEGKTIIKEKIIIELQELMHQHQVDSEVTDLTLTYILAN